MIDYVTIYQTNRELYNQMDIIKTIGYFDIFNYIKAFKQKYDVENKDFDYWLNKSIYELPVIHDIIKYYKERKPKNQIYCLIKDNKCYIGVDWQLTYYSKQETIDAAIDYFKHKNYLVDTLATLYRGEIHNEVIICSNGVKFMSIIDAAEYAINSGLTKLTFNGAITQIKRAIDKNQKAFGYKWAKEKRVLEINTLEYELIDNIKRP